MQLICTLTCPALASFLLQTISHVATPADQWLSGRLLKFYRLVPDAVPVLLLSGLMFSFIWSWATLAVDSGAKAIASRKGGSPQSNAPTADVKKAQ